MSSFAADPPKTERLTPPGGQLGQTVEARLVGKSGDGQLRVWDHLGELEFRVAEKQDAVSIAIPEDATPCLHWLRFYNEHGASDLRPFFVGVVPELAETEPNNTPAEAGNVEGPSHTINGVLEKTGDVDVYSIPVKRGETLVASVQANRDLGSPMDAVLQILDASGSVVAQNDDDHGLDPQLDYAAAKSGTHFVRVFAFPAKPNSTIKLAGAATYVYRLTLSTSAFAEFAIPAVVDGREESSVSLRGWNLTEHHDLIPLAAFTSRYATVNDQLAMSISVANADHVCTTEATTKSVQVPGTISGVIAAAGETDAWLLSGTKGQKLTITAAARSMYSQLDPVLTVTSSAGKTIKQADDRSKTDLDAEVAVTLPTDGEYKVEVSDRFGSGSPRHFYVLSCVETAPSATATLTANSFVLTHDKPLEIPVAIARKNGLKGKISVALDGLPDWVTADTTVSEEKGDSAKKVTLKLTQAGGAKPFSGSVRIHGTPENVKTTFKAAAPIQNSIHETTDIWLTVIPDPEKAELPAADADAKGEEQKTE